MADLTLKIHVPSPPDLNNTALELHQDGYDIDITLRPGTNIVFTSEPFHMGVVHGCGGRALHGQLVFQYTYDVSRKMITVCHSDYPSARGMAIITWPEGLEEVSIERAASAGFSADEGWSNRFWNHRAQLYSGASDAFKLICQRANETLIKELSAPNGLSVLVQKMPPRLPMEHYYSLCKLYHEGKLVGSPESNHAFSPDQVVSPVESQLDGIVEFDDKEDFANVIGSTNDKEPPEYQKYGGWLGIWEHMANEGEEADVCTSKGYPEDVECDDSLVGGHIIKDATKAAELKKGSEVWLLPICKTHNKKDKTYMKAIKYQTAVHMIDYDPTGKLKSLEVLASAIVSATSS